jgi:hypothetical protein
MITIHHSGPRIQDLQVLYRQTNFVADPFSSGTLPRRHWYSVQSTRYIQFTTRGTGAAAPHERKLVQLDGSARRTSYSVVRTTLWTRMLDPLLWVATTGRVSIRCILPPWAICFASETRCSGLPQRKRLGPTRRPGQARIAGPKIEQPARPRPGRSSFLCATIVRSENQKKAVHDRISDPLVILALHRPGRGAKLHTFSDTRYLSCDRMIRRGLKDVHCIMGHWKKQ